MKFKRHKGNLLSIWRIKLIQTHNFQILILQIININIKLHHQQDRYTFFFFNVN